MGGGGLPGSGCRGAAEGFEAFFLGGGGVWGYGVHAIRSPLAELDMFTALLEPPKPSPGP